ncbi:MAG: rhamnogalacturonan acetylesterase, partial [Haliscomenobacter sp.]
TPIADDTHFSNYGAYLLAQCIVYALQEQQHPLAAYLQKNLPAFEPGKPMPAQQFLMPASPDIWLVKPEGN